MYEGVSVTVKANVYFDGKVVSYSLTLKDGTKKTLGLIYPGEFTFNTGAPERMDITAGACKYRLKGADGWSACEAGGHFLVPGDSSFDLSVESGTAEYVCSFG
jgi:hypothetical protein